MKNIQASNLWDKLSSTTKVGLDSFDPKDYLHFQPSFGTCNPAIIRNHFLNEEASVIRNSDFASSNLEKLIVQESLPILQLLKGKIALQVNPFFANHYKQTVENAKQLCLLFEQAQIDKKRILIKIPATWEGILAAAKLEGLGISCVATAVFSLVQANTCAHYGISYIAPYVSKLQEEYLKKKHRFPKKSHYGVELVQNIQIQIDKMRSKTKILAASFQSISEVFSVSNASLITVKPKIAFDLQSETEVPPLYTWKELPNIAYAKNKDDFERKLFQDLVAPDLLAKMLNKFSLSWLNMRQLILEKKEVLAAS